MSTHVGRSAERRAAVYLVTQGHIILGLNWRTRMCEIDLITQKGDTVYFVEVKFRKTALYGRGADYITTKKQRQMTFAAESWMHARGWQGSCCLLVASVTPQDIEIIEL